MTPVACPPATGSATDRGRRRHAADAVAVVAVGDGIGVALADGIGDTAEAAVAARVAADGAARAAAGSGDAGGAVLAAREALAGSGLPGDAVLVVAALAPGRGEVAWVGDARAHLDDGDALHLLTADHTMAAAVRAAGGTPPARWEHVVTASVRSASAATMGRSGVPAASGRLVLTSDGVHRQLAGAEIALVLRATPGAAAAARQLTDLAVATGTDNASAVVVELPLRPALPSPRGGTEPLPAVPALGVDAEPAALAASAR